MWREHSPQTLQSGTSWKFWYGKHEDFMPMFIWQPYFEHLLCTRHYAGDKDVNEGGSSERETPFCGSPRQVPCWISGKASWRGILALNLNQGREVRQDRMVEAQFGAKGTAWAKA